MSNKTKTPSDAVTSRGGKATKNQRGTASFRRVNSTTKARFVCRGQLALWVDDSLPQPYDLSQFRNQREAVINFLLSGNTLTQDIATYSLKTRRLASRISELKSAGWNISREMIFVETGAARVARYWLNCEKPRVEALQ